MTKKRILILANTFYPVLGGVETHLIDLINELSKEDKLETHLIAYTYCQDRDNPYIGKYDNVKINLLKVIPRNNDNIINRLTLRSNALYFFYVIVPLFIYTLYYCLKNKRFDSVHANSHTTGVVALWISKIFGINRKLISMHGIMFSQLENFQKYTKFRQKIRAQFQHFTKVFCIGQRSYNEITELMGSDANLELFRYWVDDRFFQIQTDRSTARQELGMGKRKVVFYAGRLVETKGIVVLLQVAATASQYDFVIAGGGVLSEMVEQYSKKYGNIKFLGRVENSLLPQYYTAVDLSILLTQGDGEGIPRALIESIACGTPVVATARGGTKELVDLGTGEIVDNNPDAIKSKLDLMLNNDQIYQERQSRCRPVAKQYFSRANAQVFIRNYL